MKRHDGRRADQLRQLNIVHNVFEFASGSVLFQIGKTKVLCAVTLQSGVPPFLRGKGTGWLTAEYALLPTSTAARTSREASSMKRHGRSVEISRLISRTLRTAVDFSVLGERTITVDCDVLNADGGTRTASISGAYAALVMAQKMWLENKVLEQPFLKHEIAAVAVGVLEGVAVLDPDYTEDSSGSADINFVMTREGSVIEVQGGAEKESLPWDVFQEVCDLGRVGIAQVFEFLDTHVERKQQMHDVLPNSKKSIKPAEKIPLFSLQKRQRSLAQE